LKTKTIYLIRHGETDYNRRGVVQGSGIDSDLNELGYAQAQAFFEAYGHLPFQKIYTSKLRRTHQSVEAFLQKGTPWEQHEGLNEISWGTREGKIPNSHDNVYYRQLITSWRKGQTHQPAEGGESPLDVQKRQLNTLEHILSFPEEELILVAMHGRAMRILLATVTNVALQRMDTFEHENLCLYVLRYEYATQQFFIEKKNDTGHLAKLHAQK
jgi:broad specificity phosphatase PhoE